MSLPGAIGKKHGMTQVFDENGDAVPVSVIELLPMTVTQVKTKDNDGYTAVQVGYQDAKEKHLTKAQIGHLKKNKIKLFRHLKEFRVKEGDLTGFEVGKQAKPEFLNDIGNVNVTGRSIGKGFQGSVKLHHFGRGPMTHGSKSHRIPGSIGAGTTPGRVYKGTKMAARMGNKTVTTENLRVVKVDLDRNLLLVEGTVPGKPGAMLVIRPRNVVGSKN